MATPAPFYPFGDTPNQILNLARIRLASDILANTGVPGGADNGKQFDDAGGGPAAPELDSQSNVITRTQIMFNGAYRKFQKYLANLGYRLLLKDNLVISSLPSNNNPDPSAASWLSWNGFFNGTSLTTTPALPQDFYAPLKVRERISGQNSIFIPMRNSMDGLRNIQIRGIYNSQWEWRSNAIYLTGATSVTDLQIRYISYLPTLPDPNYPTANTPWYFQAIPIPGCSSALAWYICNEALALRGEDCQDMAMKAQTLAEDEANKVFNDQARADQRTNLRRHPRAGGHGNSRGYRYGL